MIKQMLKRWFYASFFIITCCWFLPVRLIDKEMFEETWKEVWRNNVVK